MTPAEAAVLLTAISANDNREVTEAGSRAWSAALPDVELRDALEFLPNYYRTATRDGRNWIYPGDVLTGVAKMHTDRASAAGRDARQAILDAAGEDDYEAGPRAMRALHEAIDKYHAEHSVPQLEAPFDPAAWAKDRRSA